MLTWLFYKLIRHKTRSVKYKGKAMKLLIASSFPEQMVGLSYRKGIKEDEGMFFIFGRDSEWGIWMIDMKFPIDIIWLDKAGKVVYVKKDAEPCTSIFSCETYKPGKPSRYVLELASGGAGRYGIRVGDSFPIS